MKKILLISLSNIGDAILTTPVLQTLHELCPSAVIDIVSDHRSSMIYEHCPYRGKIFHKDKRGLFRGALSLLQELRQTYYDLIVDLRTDGLAYLLRGQKKLTKWRVTADGPHAVEKHMAVIKSINPANEVFPTKIWLTSSHADFAEQQLRDLDGNNYLVIAPGCHAAIKIWSPQNYALVCNQLDGDFDGVIIVGGPGDKKYAARVSKQLSVPFKDLSGETNILQAAAIMQHASMFIGNDSGLGHIASAGAVPSLTLFGIGEPLRYHPWGDQAKWLQGANNDINAITVSDVVKAVREICRVMG